jgi:hypothetical protein
LATIRRLDIWALAEELQQHHQLAYFTKARRQTRAKQLRLLEEQPDYGDD